MVINGDDVALRAGPNTTEPVIMRLSKNSILTRVDNTGRYNIGGYIWDRVELPNGKKGFVARNFLADINKSDNIYRVKVKDYLIMRASPSTSAQDIRHLGDGVLVTVTEKVNGTVNGYTWYKITTAEGAEGYVASDYLVNVNGKTDDGQNNNPASQQSVQPAPQPNVQPAPQPERKPDNGNSSLIDNKNDEKKIIRVSPDAKADDLKKKYSNVKDISNNDLGTGTTVKIDNKEYKIIKVGDVNGDGRVTAKDSTQILKYVVKLIDLNDEQKNAADINKDGNVTAKDSTLILKHVVKLINIQY